ncbi:MAG: TIR domain-containing protein [Flammeovirgaceae bacterium]|nr:TIR domain-containing protein [Flammeovirgaceae bacterium]
MSKIHSRIDESSKDLDNSALKKIFERARDEKTEYLDLSKNQFTEINIPFALPHLKVLDLSYNKAELTKITIPEGFDNLKYLWIYQSNLKEIEIKGAMPMLDTLHLAENKLESIALEEGFGELVTLYLQKNQLKEFPIHLLDELPKIEFLSLQENPIHNIPSEITSKEGNVLGDVQTYLHSIIGKKTDYLNQAKLILIGNGKVGKSSIKIKLLDENAPLPKEDERTPGLDIAMYTIKDLDPAISSLEEPIDFDLSIWDFGGQGKYREVQQFFCSPKSLYLFVTSLDDKIDKEDYIGFEYWLSMARAYGYDKTNNKKSPVIHVLNKIDLLAYKGGGGVDYNPFERQEQFSEINEFVRISCDTLENFPVLKKAIEKSLPKIERTVFENEYNNDWFKVKKELEELDENHISRQQYEDICKKHGLDKKETDLWLDILDRIGFLIYFRENPTLKDFIVLKPLWIKEAIYLVLDFGLIQNGELKPEYFNYIWEEYSPEEHQNLLDLMLAYKFCYKQENQFGEPTYIVPGLLWKIEPKNLPKEEDYQFDICFEYAPFIPAGTVNKLMVDLNENIYQNLKWKNSCILFLNIENQLTLAEVKEDWENKVIHVKLGGNNVAELYELIHSQLLGLLDEIKSTKLIDNLGLTKKVKIGKKYYDKEEVEDLGKGGEFGFLFGEGASIPRAAMKSQKQMSKEKENGIGEEGEIKIKVFISYNHKDKSIAKKIKLKLEANGIKVTIDSVAMNAGEDIKTFIENCVRNNDITLSLVSSNSLLSAWVAMESVLILTGEKIGDKKFIPCTIDNEFFSRDFVDDALDFVENEIEEIDKVIEKRRLKKRGIEDLQNDLSRFTQLKNKLPEIVQRLKESLTIDISGDQFKEGMEKIISSIQKGTK